MFAVQVPPWPKSIQWYNSEGRVETGDRYRILEDGLGGYSVEISALEASDDGEWKCVATSFEGVRGISTAVVTLTCKTRCLFNIGVICIGIRSKTEDLVTNLIVCFIV